ncbi:MAG: 16S rRNA (cytosine(967)-C(5))-methyltransferase RsmB [Bacillaceae bacterium]|nr:16S rRNA (cytosine(967)-C(5))-methyltransferase RsmB [Bacillaceae bacterium]
MKKVRDLALEALLSVEKNQAYSNLLLNNYLDKKDISKKDAGLFTEIVYGTIQRKITLDYYLQPFIGKQKKMQDWVKVLLRLSLYQMLYLDRVPERAIIHEAVEIAKKRGHKGIAGVVNGVLRSVQRNGVASLEEIVDPVERISIASSHPKWIVEKWVSQYGVEKTEEMCLVNLQPPYQTARVNENKGTVEEILEKLESEGYDVRRGDLSPVSILCLKGNLAHSNLFKEGYFTIQDESSMLVAPALHVSDDDKVYDSCAAPGGKSTHIAELLKGTGKVISSDLHKHKIELINEQTLRLSLNNVETYVLDSRKATETFKEESFDKVLIDAPCSGFGVIRRKPDLKYTKTMQDVKQLAKIQLDILTEVAPLVKKGGTLVYSTCTIDKEENEEVVNAFLELREDFMLDEELQQYIPEKAKEYVKNGMLQLLPHYFNTDGFFIARLKRQV